MSGMTGVHVPTKLQLHLRRLFSTL